MELKKKKYKKIKTYWNSVQKEHTVKKVLIFDLKSFRS